MVVQVVLVQKAVSGNVSYQALGDCTTAVTSLTDETLGKAGTLGAEIRGSGRDVEPENFGFSGAAAGFAKALEYVKGSGGGEGGECERHKPGDGLLGAALSRMGSISGSADDPERP